MCSALCEYASSITDEKYIALVAVIKRVVNEIYFKLINSYHPIPHKYLLPESVLMQRAQLPACKEQETRLCDDYKINLDIWRSICDM